MNGKGAMTSSMRDAIRPYERVVHVKRVWFALNACSSRVVHVKRVWFALNACSSRVVRVISVLVLIFGIGVLFS